MTHTHVTAPTQFVECRGNQFAYRRLGATEGVPVVFLQHFTGTMDYWDPAVVDGYHEDGFGFGVIAQALWISRNLTGTEGAPGDASLAEEILVAKRLLDDAHAGVLADIEDELASDARQQACGEGRRHRGAVLPQYRAGTDEAKGATSDSHGSVLHRRR